VLETIVFLLCILIFHIADGIPMGTIKDSEVTRKKIIDAAGQLFAERGFKGVTVRDIVRQADTHLSALNYHFRTKDALYREVVLEACRLASISENDQRLLNKLDPKEALHQLVKNGLKGYQRGDFSHWQVLIITREIWEPSPVFSEVVEKYFKPEAEFVANLIGKITGKNPDSHEVRFAFLTMTALMETFGLYGHWVDAIAPGLGKHFDKKDRIVKKILQMTIAAADDI
jgi:AcrR family transcriptional regulator